VSISFLKRPLKLQFYFVLFALAFVLTVAGSAMAGLPGTPPDGAYPGNNTAEGDQTLSNVNINVGNQTGTFNVAVGFRALNGDTDGAENTAVGCLALEANKIGSANTAMGYRALLLNVASRNTAYGNEALMNAKNSGAADNTAVGYRANFSSLAGANNTAVGSSALYFNTGASNTAVGAQALKSGTTGSTGNNNTAVGYEALWTNQSGSSNTACGYAALAANNKGGNNTAVGLNALVKNVSGGNNTALGVQAGSNLTTGSYNIDIGNDGLSADGTSTVSNPGVIRLGDSSHQSQIFIAGIAPVGGGTAVNVLSSGQLVTTNSSQRFKKYIKSMDSSSDVVLALKPVTFYYKNDNTSTPQFGLIAEEVEKVSPDLITRDEEGKPYSVRYDAVNAMLLNEFLKEHRKVEEQGAMIAKQQKQIDALTAGLQKISTRIETNESASRVVDNN
jgi:Chaperone of endosialidase